MYSTGSCAPPPPPQLANGSIPARRIQTSVQPEMPSCVQNAMMTKDKKPFTYTPCGIDLSQIKSPRMAKRIQRNANMEGVTNQPKPSPLAQQHNNDVAPRPSVHTGGLGMPVQVFPNGPPPPPPVPSKFGAPPPPPPGPTNYSQLSAPANNANRSPSPSRKSPQPQNFEPPPLGCRPEIKIPSNPMATLRKVPTPKPKDDFWVEEYRHERSKSPLPSSVETNNQNSSSNQANNDLFHLPEPLCQANDAIQNSTSAPQQTFARQTSLKNDFSQNQNNNYNNQNNNNNYNTNSLNNNNQNNNNSYSTNSLNNNNQPTDLPQQRIYSPFSSSSPTPNLPKPLSPIKLTQDNSNMPIYVRSSQRKTSPPPTPLHNNNANINNSPHESHQDAPPYYVRSHQRPNVTPPSPANLVPTLQKQPSLEQPKPSTPAHPQHIPIYCRPARNVSQSPQTFQKQSSVEQKPQPQPQPQFQQRQHHQPQENENVPIYVRSFQNQQRVLSPPPVNSQQNNGFAVNEKVQPNNQTVPPPWMAKRRNSNDAPEWVNQNENNINRPASVATTNGYKSENTNQNAQNHFAASNNMNAMNNSAAKERIVPIQFDQPTAKILTSPAGFTAQPYQNSPPQYNRVQAPYSPTGNAYSPNYNGNPNKFVDQGYQDWNAIDQRRNVMSPTKFVNSSAQNSQDGSRIVPIRLEEGHPYLNGPVSQSPTVIQNDSRTTPNQSKSFRVLQQITDTLKTDPFDNDASHAAELQQPHYSRPIGQNDINENQMRKMRLNDYEQRRHNQDANLQGKFVSPHGCHNDPHQQYQQQQNNTVPSRSFKLLQAMTKPENAADVQAKDIEQELDSYDYYNSDIPLSNVPYTVSLPDTPLPSECGDSIVHSAADIADDNDDDIYDDIYQSCTYDSYNENNHSSNFPSNKPVATNVPRIVVTPTPEDDATRRRASLTNADQPLCEGMSEQIETFALLTSTLNALNRNDIEQNIERNEKLFMGDENKFTNSPSTYSANSSILDCCENNLDVHEISKASADFQLDSSDSESESDIQSDDEMPQNDRKRNDSLQAVRSVANIKVYDEELYDDEQQLVVQEMHRNQSNLECELREIDDDSDENSDDIINFVIDNNHGCDEVDESIASCDLLSVIYEEDDDRSAHSKRPTTVSSSASNSNNSSTMTLAHEDQQMIIANDNDSSDDDTEEQEQERDSSDDESDNNNDCLTDDDDENSTSVTVRLPLRLSFSRSSNNEEVTTVVVGNSEIEDTGIVESNSDVSVSFSLNNRSIDRSVAYSNHTSLDLSNYQPANFDNDASDSEVSVSVSLPMKKKTLDSPRPFVRQQTLSPVFHAKDDFEYRPWKSIDIEDPVANANVQQHCKPFKIESNFDECEETNEEEDGVANDQLHCDENKVSVRDRVAAFDKSTNEFRQKFIASRSRSPSTEPESESESVSEYEDEKMPENVFVPVVSPPADTTEECIEIDNNNNCCSEEVECDEQANRSVRDKIASFEAPSQYDRPKFDMAKETMPITVAAAVGKEQRQLTYQIPIAQNKLHPSFKSLNRNSYMQQSFQDESELDEDDSGVTSDISRRISEETDDTESECFPELRKLTRYERAATHSRLFKLLQQDCENDDSNDTQKRQVAPKNDSQQLPCLYKPKKIIHNVSITRKMNPELVKNAETMAERRERLSLNVKQSTSIDADNLSCSSSPTPSSVNERLIDELVQSVLQQTKQKNMKNIPIDKIQAAARKALQQQQQQQHQDEFDSCDTAFNSFDSTPALTPHEFRDDSFDDCDTWNNSSTDYDRKLPATVDILPSKAFKNLQEQSLYGRKRKLWAARCPRVLSSKTVNTDLGRVTESRESQSPEPSYYSHLS